MHSLIIFCLETNVSQLCSTKIPFPRNIIICFLWRKPKWHISLFWIGPPLFHHFMLPCACICSENAGLFFYAFRIKTKEQAVYEITGIQISPAFLISLTGCHSYASYVSPERPKNRSTTCLMSALKLSPFLMQLSSWSHQPSFKLIYWFLYCSV